VLSAYVLSSYQRVRNHLAQAEGWILTAAHLLLLAEYFPTYAPVWSRTLALCLEAWETSVDALAREALASTDWAEGDLLTDSLVISYRAVTLAGYLSTYALWLKRRDRERDLRDAIYLRIERSVKERKLFFWGESASPHFYAVMLLLQSRGDEKLACDFAAGVISTITRENKRGRMPGVPDPYCTPDELVRQYVFGEEIFPDNVSFAGRAYTLRAFVEFLARRERKQALKSLWYGITGVDAAEFIPAASRDLYRWRNRDGSLSVEQWDQPQQWPELYDAATSTPERQNILAREYPELLLPFALVYPHRFTVAMSRLIEQVLVD